MANPEPYEVHELLNSESSYDLSRISSTKTHNGEYKRHKRERHYIENSKEFKLK